MLCAEISVYIRPDSVVASPVCIWSVTWSLLLRSLLGCVRGVGFWFHGCVEPLCRPDQTVNKVIMSSNVDSLAVIQSGVATSASTPLPGTFLGLALDFGSDRLYDLVDNIPDVMGLRDVSAGQPLCPGGDAG